MAGAGHSFRATWVRQLSQRTSLPEQMSQPELTVVSQGMFETTYLPYLQNFDLHVYTEVLSPVS